MHPRVKALVERAQTAGASIDEIAAESGLSRSKIYRWTHGTGPRLDAMEAAEAALERLIAKRQAALSRLTAS